MNDAPDQEPAPVSARKKRIVADLHTRLAVHFPAYFHHIEEAVPYYEIKSDPASPLLIVDPDLDRSWLRPPVPKPDDSFGYWPAATCKLPPTRRTLFPPTTKAKPLGRTPYYHVPDDTLRKTLDSATQMDKVHLDLKAFDVADVSIRNAPQAALDVLLRRAMLENYTTDAYLQLVFELSECISGASQTVTQLEAIELLSGVVRQAAMANARAGQSLSAGYVGNIVALRDTVLGRFTVPKRTMEILRGGDFTGNSLFAPLPESFSSLLDTVSGAELRCTSGSARPKPPSVPVAAVPAAPAAAQSLKRHNPSGSNPRSKFLKTSQALRGKGGSSFHKKPAGRGSRAGRY